jgi:hypothetical protein
MAKEINYYGQLRPTGVDNSAVKRLQAIAGLADQVQSIAVQAGAKMAQDKGSSEGAVAGQKAAQAAESQRKQQKAAPLTKSDEELIPPVADGKEKPVFPIADGEEELVLNSTQTAAIERQPLKKREGILSAFSIRDRAYNDALESAYLSQISIDSKNAVARVKAQAPDDTIAFNKLMEGTRQGILDNVDPRYRDVVAGTLDNVINAAKTDVFTNEVVKVKDFVDEVQQNAIETSARASRNFAYDGDEVQARAEAAEAIGIIASRQATDPTSFAEGEEQKREITLDLESQLMMGRLARKAESEGYEAGIEALELLEKPSEFDQDEWAAFKSSASSRLKMAEETRKTAMATEIADAEIQAGLYASDLELKITLGSVTPQEGNDLAIKAYKDGIITQKKLTQLRKLAFEKLSEDQEKAESISRVSRAMNPETDTDDPTMYRADGSKKSARGYIGPVENLVQGGTMTEVSIGVEINGEEMQVPAMVPTLTQEEIDTLANMQIEGNAKEIPESIKDKAIAHAEKRLAEGKSVFYVDGESGEYEYDQEDVDTFYEATGLANRPMAERWASDYQVIESTRFIPEQVKETIDRALLTDDGEGILYAVNLYDQVLSMPGGDQLAKDLVSDGQLALFTRTVSLMNAGFSHTDAVSRARQYIDMPDLAAKVEQQIKTENYADDYPKWTEKAIGGTSNIIEQARAERQFKTIFEEMLFRGMDKSDALAATKKRMNSIYGESPSYGVMAYPPEDFPEYIVGTREETSDYIRKQVYEEVTSEGLFAEDITMDDITLVSDDWTARTASTGKPQYAIMVSTDEGLRILSDTDGNIYFTPDVEKEQARIVEERKADAAILRSLPSTRDTLFTTSPSVVF